MLIFNGIGALYGGGHLILYPDGSSIQLSLNWLENTPFHDYLIPGIILFIANGLFSLLAFGALIFNLKNSAWFVMAQGAIMSGWIVIQIILIQTVYFLHFIMGGVGISLAILGWILVKYNEQPSQSN